MRRHVRPENTSDAGVCERRRRFRLLVRGACFLAAIAALWPLLPGVNSSLWIPALSPFVALAGAIATREFHAIVWLGVVAGVVALLRHRFFCRWVCPMGFSLDGASWLGRRLKRRPVHMPWLGQWIVLLTLGGACLGYPLLLWLDPLAIFTSVLSLGERQLGYAAWLAATGFVAVLTSSVLWPAVWCGGVCPLGAFQDLLHKASRFPRPAADCAGESRRECEKPCVPGVAASRPQALATALSGEGKTIAKLRLTMPPGECMASRTRSHKADGGLSRRVILGVAAGAGSAGIAGLLGHNRSRPIRPPNAREESRFVGLCTRCGNCVRSCPGGIIERDLGGHGLASLLTPVLSFRSGYCREDCVRCTEVCPSGALVCLPVKNKAGVRMGRARVDMDVCLLAEDRECSACARWCPYGAIRYVFSEERYALQPQIDPDKCNGCGACEAACPTRPSKAIVVLPV